ncbi:MAG: SUMF1/EgtB/PvdO family nonheme iron enzyme [Bacteroidales bacterium]|nr:SUMF1/EgtB/PvdO family nonheme iron enzyme [Bacteroidales bacterium]
MKQPHTPKQYFLLTFFFFLLSSQLLAQDPEFKVKSFTHEQTNLLARVEERLDDNDEVCAVILVRTAETGLGFEVNSGIVGNTEWKSGDYRVYVSAGARNLKIFKQGIKTIEYLFEIRPKSGETYLLELEVIRPEPKLAVLPVTIITTPENASLSIDGNKVNTQTKTHQLAEGEHQPTIEMPGYETLQQSIQVDKNKVFFTFKLNEVSNAALMIESDPPGASFYLDGINLGTTPISVFYPPGTYPIKISKEGYLTIENETLELKLPQTRKSYTLEENVGFLTINTRPEATVYFNGEKVSNPKKVKLTPQLVKIKVTMPKSADQEQQIVLNKEDDIVLDMYPDIQTGTLQVAVTPFDANIELTGDAGEHYTAQGMKIFSDIPVGTYTLKITAEGYKTNEESLVLKANEKQNKSIALEKGSEADYGIEMVLVKGGTFKMGCTNEQGNDCDDEEKSTHQVTVSDYYIGKYEVTQQQWKAIMGKSPSYNKNCDNCPVEVVSWNDIQKFIKKLNRKTDKNYRLPTEAEWEYAARGGAQSRGYKYAGSNNLGDVGWYGENSGYKTHPVGQKKANELGIYDMSGNVWEWCSDWYDLNYYSSSPRTNPQGAASGFLRVVRGGSWLDAAQDCRVGFRFIFTPVGRIYFIGFRLAVSP